MASYALHRGQRLCFSAKLANIQKKVLISTLLLRSFLAEKRIPQGLDELVFKAKRPPHRMETTASYLDIASQGVPAAFPSLFFLLCHGTRRHPTSPIDVVLRGYAVQVEVQEPTAARVVRNRQPIVTAGADVVQRTIKVAAKARSREVDSSCLTAACPEIMTEVVWVSLPMVCTINIHWAIVLTISRKTCKRIRSWHLKADRTRIINRLDDRIVIATCCRVIG